MLSKMDVKDAFRYVAVEWDGCTKYVLGNVLVVDTRLLFGWWNSPGFNCLLAMTPEHAYCYTSFDASIVTLQGLASPRRVRVDISAAGETALSLLTNCNMPGRQGGVTF